LSLEDEDARFYFLDLAIIPAYILSLEVEYARLYFLDLAIIYTF
jgi:hypothetical protein